MRRRSGRAWVRPAAGLALAAVALALVVQVMLFVLPAGEEPHRADVVVVLGGPGPRIERGEQLLEAGYADTWLVATDVPQSCRWDAPSTLLCFTPDPNTTRGEARAVAKLAREHGWDDLLVVVQNEQAVRALLRLRRCLGHDVLVTPVTVRGSLADSLYRTVYESLALPKALLFQRAC